MNKKLKSISCILAATCTFLVAENTMKIGPLAVDVVSAATGEAPAPAPAPSKPATSTKTTTTTSYTSGKATRLLAVGSAGDDVKLVQTNLNAKGYKLTVDGFYGPLTANAVKGFQKAVGLIVDGIVGPNTLAVLIPSSAVPTSIVNVGSVGNDVKYLQTNLNKLGYKLSVDGIFGNLTSAAVKSFQKANGLIVDGIAGPNTFGKLFEKVSAPVTPAKPVTPTTPTTPTTPPVDTVTSASQVNDEATFEKNIADPNSDYMQIVNKNLTFTKDLTVVSGTKPGANGAASTPNRSIAPAAEDSTGKVTSRYTITVPNLILSGLNEKVEYGIIKGDIYVQNTGFTLKDATINGNLYFANQALMDAFKKDATTTISGTIAVKAYTPVDVVTSASQVNDEATFEKNIADPNSDYMQIVNKNLTFTKDLTVVSGTKPGTNGAAGTPSRSIAPAAEDLTTKAITARYTITVPNLVFSGLNEKVEYGIIKGNVYVQNTGFTLKDAKVDGNLYFATQALMDAFVKDATTTITGTIAVKTYTPAVDVVTSASQVNDEATFEKNITDPNSYYMQIVNKDLTFTKDLTVVSATKPGTNGAAGTPNRSIAPCVEDLTTKQITKQYTITVPNLILSGQNEKVEYGIVKGNVYVQNTGFTLPNATINGNLYFASQTLLDAYNQLAATSKGTVTGTIAVKTY